MKKHSKKPSKKHSKKQQKNQWALLCGGIAVVLCSVILICVFAGPKKDPATIGSVILSVNAAVKVDYDANGNVTKLAPVNSNGTVLMDSLLDFKGKSCSQILCQLLDLSSQHGYYTDNTKTVILMQGLRSQLPESENFLEGLQSDLMGKIKEGQTVQLITLDHITPEGYINMEMAKQLLLQHLGIREFEYFEGGDDLHYDCYGFFVRFNSEELFYNVDAFTGNVFIGNPDDFFSSVEDTYPTDPPYQDPVSPENPGDEFEFPI